MGKIKNEQPHIRRMQATRFRDVIVMLKWRHQVASQHIQEFLEAFSYLSNINEVFSGEQEKESIISVRMG